MFKLAVNHAAHPPVTLAGDVEFDPGDREYPISVECDGYMTLKDAKELHQGLTEAIRRADAGDFQVVPVVRVDMPDQEPN